MTYRDARFGPRIGQYMGKPIFKSIDTPEGHYEFDRIASYQDDGYPLDQLGGDEIMYPEGVVYRRTG